MFRFFLSGRRRNNRKPEPQASILVSEMAEAWLESLRERSNLKYTPGACREALDRNLLPALGKRSIGSITRSEMEKIHDELEHDPAQANCVLWASSEVFRYAEAQKARPRATNPCIYIKAYPEPE